MARAIAELLLLLAPTGLELETTHWCSERNQLCDALSRISDGAEMPEVWLGVQTFVPIWRDLTFADLELICIMMASPDPRG